MRSVLRIVPVALVAALAIGAVAASGASAHQWKVNGAEASGQEVTVTGSEFKDEVSSIMFSCKSVTGTARVKAAGAGEATELKFTGCTTNKANCTMYSEGEPVGTLVAADLPTQLVERETAFGSKVLAEDFEEVKATKRFMTIKFKSEVAKACEPLAEEWWVKGQVLATVTNLAGGTVGLNFPKPELKGNTLNVGLGPLKIFGSLTDTLTGGGTLTAS